MENSLYYTFSTISQTLAGAIGILGAFLIYHLSDTQRSLNEYLEKLYSFYPRAQETLDLDFMWEHGDIDGLLKYFREDKLRCFEVGDCLAQHLYLVPAERLHMRRFILLKRLKTALLLTCITIVFSLVVLSTVPCLAGWFGNRVACILIVGLLLTSLCMFYYVRIVLTIFQK